MRFSSRFALSLAIALSFLLLFGIQATFAADEMSMDEYRAQLKQYQDQEAAANQAAEECAAALTSLKAQIEEAQAEVDKTWDEILQVIGTDQAGVDAYGDKVKALEAQVDGLLALTPEELFKKRDELKAAEEQLAELKKDRISVLTEMQNSLAAIEGKIARLKNKMPKAMYDQYTVVVGDYLWKISGKQDIYNNPMHWMRIYSYNKDQIKNPDLIYPEQIFKIQRECGPDEYLVAKGDFLKKIAANPDVLGDPAAWTKIYEKNKDIIGDDPHRIFPYTVLVIPR
ncbi:LysM peptidoglycan-binding domain-containing protein [candidate division KSB1 bacterium]|nr:LysM peptidoglycan-binding domain-containing protein [candidate division KSB1 bacterium]